MAEPETVWRLPAVCVAGLQGFFASPCSCCALFSLYRVALPGCGACGAAVNARLSVTSPVCYEPCALRVQRALRRAWRACGCRPGGQGHGTRVPALTPARASPPRLRPPSDRISSQTRPQRQPPPSCTWPSCLRCRLHKPLAPRLRISHCRCVLLPLYVIAGHGAQALLRVAHRQVPAYTCVSCRRHGLLEAPLAAPTQLALQVHFASSAPRCMPWHPRPARSVCRQGAVCTCLSC